MLLESERTAAAARLRAPGWLLVAPGRQHHAVVAWRLLYGWPGAVACWRWACSWLLSGRWNLLQPAGACCGNLLLAG